MLDERRLVRPLLALALLTVACQRPSSPAPSGTAKGPAASPPRPAGPVHGAGAAAGAGLIAGQAPGTAVRLPSAAGSTAAPTPSGPVDSAGNPLPAARPAAESPRPPRGKLLTILYGGNRQGEVEPCG